MVLMGDILGGGGMGGKRREKRRGKGRERGGQGRQNFKISPTPYEEK